MFEKSQHRKIPSRPVAKTGHRCLGCLRGNDPEKRACALRRMLAEGYAPDWLAQAQLPNIKTE
jgi:hypothetical protein